MTERTVPDLVRTTALAQGEIGRRWLDALPATLTVGTAGHVAQATAADGALLVAKVAVPSAAPWRLLVRPPRSESAHDLDAEIREFNRDLLTGDVAGVDAEEIWQWGFIERVSTGLHTLQLGHPGARDFLTVADRWSADA
jgi:streptomycin 6-kinase